MTTAPMTTESFSRAEIRKIIHTLLIPTIIFVVSLAITGMTSVIPGLNYSSGKTPPIPMAVGETFLILSSATLFNRVLELFVWHRLRMHGQPVPRLISDLVIAVVWYSAACAVAAYAFDQSLTHLITASTVALGVIGLALQRPILDGFSGIVLALQRPFGVGDWIGISNDTAPFGKVVDMNWRAVHVLTPNEVLHVIPNGQFTSNDTRLYSKPEPYFRDEITITLPLNVTTHQGQRILLGAANQVEEVGNLPRKAIVTIGEYGDRGVVWKLLFWCADPARLLLVRFAIHQNILKNLKYAGIEIPVSTMNIRRAVDTGDVFNQIQGVEPIIQRLSLFATLTVDELRYLSSHCISKLAVAGKPLLKEGEMGDSLFVLCEGLLEVSKSGANAANVVIGRIHPGQFFGERTFLLGEPRSATVVPVIDAIVIEISKGAMTSLLQARPELATHLAEVLSERHALTDAKLNALPQPVADADGLMDKMVDRIIVFFEIKKQRAKPANPSALGIEV
jgi:small-conductance mechanosensitive channel/CRP-like cAMP-binding protein